MFRTFYRTVSHRNLHKLYKSDVPIFESSVFVQKAILDESDTYLGSPDECVYENMFLFIK